MIHNTTQQCKEKTKRSLLSETEKLTIVVTERVRSASLLENRGYVEQMSRTRIMGGKMRQVFVPGLTDGRWLGGTNERRRLKNGNV